MELASVNWSAVVAGTAAAFAYCFALYAPFAFGPVWVRGARVERPEGAGAPVFAMVVQIVGLFLLATIVGITETQNALGTAIVAILAAALLLVGNGAFAYRSPGSLAVDGASVIGSGVLMILAQGLL